MLVPMKRLTLVAHSADEEAIMKALQSIAAVEVISSGEAKDDKELAALENTVARLKSASQVLRLYADKPKMGPKPEYAADELASGLPASMELVEKVEEADRLIAQVKNERDKQTALIAQLEPWSDMDSPIEDIKPTRAVRYLTGFIKSEQLDELTDRLPAAVTPFGGGRTTAVLIAVSRDDMTEVQRELKEYEYQDFTFPKLTGTPNDNIARCRERLAELDKREAELKDGLTEAAKDIARVQSGFDAAAIERDREAVKTKVASTETAFILEGWVRSDDEDEVRNTLEAVTPAFYMELRDPLEDETPPSVVKNSKLVAPYEAVTNLYSKPDPNGIDATPLMAPFYFLFFGLMLSDTGYGIVLTLGAFFYLKFMKPQGMTEAIAKVLVMGGISTIICGFFVGTFFGMDWNNFLGTPAGTFPLLFDPMKEPMSMLYLCFGLGLFHMLFGVAINVWRCIKRKDYAAAIFDNASWLMIVIGILVFASPSLVPGIPAIASTIGLGMAGLGAALVFLFAGRAKKNVLKRAISGAGKLYDVTSYLSDMLSYARVFALGLSTGVIASVMNTLVGMVSESFQSGFAMQAIGFILCAVLLAVLHMFSIAINVLGCFVHCARLQYVEFYGKFYDAGGKDFRPLGYNTKNVRVKKAA